MLYILTGMLLTLMIVYIFIQFLSRIYETRFRTVVALLLGQSALSFIVSWLIVCSYTVRPKWISAVPLLWAIITAALAFIKMLFMEFLYVRPSKSTTRARVEVGLKHDTFKVFTEDNVEIAGFHIRSGHNNAIILVHGGSRCKNSFENLGLAQWLSYEYDIISFDTRGHFESGGYWTADGKTRLDLLAIINYTKNQGYEKIGVIGRSLGGWTSLLVAAEVKEIDSLIVISAPLGHIRETPLVSNLDRLKGSLGKIIVRAMQGLRYHDYDESQIEVPWNIANKLTLPVFLIYGQKDKVIGLEKDDIQRFYQQIPSKKRLFMFPESAHLPFPWHLGPIYLMSIQWFSETLKESRDIGKYNITGFNTMDDNGEAIQGEQGEDGLYV